MSEIDTWEKCYPSAWKGIITPESFSHPAKFSSRLIERIYQHGIECGWLHEGSRIVDPFGGVGLGAWPALRFGMDWTGVELEPKFQRMGSEYDCPGFTIEFRRQVRKHGISIAHLCPTCESKFRQRQTEYIDPATIPVEAHHYLGNIGTWNARYSGRLARWGTARIIQGDSRHRAQVIGAAEACISSPPFCDQLFSHDNFISPHDSKARGAIDYDTAYGSTPGNLGNLPPGDVDAVISSPPDADGAQHTGGEDTSPEHIQGGDLRYVAYGSTPGQLATLPLGAPPAFDACVASPPFENHNQFEHDCTVPLSNYKKTGGPWKQYEVAESTGQLGNDSGDTFWSAAREIVAQVYTVLAPGAHAIWVVKSYVKNKALVDFPHQWQALCEAVGFVTLHEHHALLVRHNGTSIDIDGNHHEHKTESKSFFRRLAEKNGSPRIDYETVLCMIKPGGSGGGWDGAISSPPFLDNDNRGNREAFDKLQEAIVRDGHGHGGKFGPSIGHDYGTPPPGQLGSLPPGSLSDALNNRCGG